MRGIPFLAALLLLTVDTSLRAQAPPERTRILCDPGKDPRCPGLGCSCLQTSLEVTFDGLTDSVFRYETFTPDARVETKIVLDVKEAAVQGWSFGVTHESNYLQLGDVNIQGTASEVAKSGGFVVADLANIQTCETEPPPGCTNPQPSSGYISAVILSFTETLELPFGPQVVCNANYALKADAGPRGTLIRPTNRLKKAGSPPVDMNITVAGLPAQPGHIVYGWVKRAGDSSPAGARKLCDPATDSRCPGLQCPCEPNGLELRFDASGGPVHEYDSFTAKAPVEASVFMDVQTPGVQGWSFGVDHDGDYLAIQGVTVDGTTAEVAETGGFVAISSDVIETCGRSPDLDCVRQEPGSGFIMAVVLSFTQRLVLPMGLQRIARVSYSLESDPGANGTRVFFVEYLAVKGSPPASINIPVDGRATGPSNVLDGWVKRAGDSLQEICDNGTDDDDDGKVDCSDIDCRVDNACMPPLEICDNGADDDRDGLTDCLDGDCRSEGVCVPRREACDNGVDDDLDGWIDCQDSDCSLFPKCVRESCRNGIDDDQDGATDCADSECEDAIVCRREICDNGIDDNANAMTDCYDSDCKEFPACEPKPEICDNGLDDDFDTKLDCGDPDCKKFEACIPKPEICDNRIDDDLDGRTDCRDRDCAEAAACAPGPEVCDDCFDNDRDGLMDCEDEECATHPHCSPKPEVCDNLIDDDDDGLVDRADADCPDGALVALGGCAEYGFYFGPEATNDDSVAAPDGFVISLRNRSPVVSFRVCLRRELDRERVAYSFASGFVVNEFRSGQRPLLANRVLASASHLISHVERAAATTAFAGWDFLATQAAPSTTDGICLTVNYVTDLNVENPYSVIPPTRPEDHCSANEILRVVTMPLPRLRRGELDGTPGLGITDAVVIIKWLATGVSPYYDCRDAMDVDDDGTIGITDPIVVLRYLFQEGVALAAPFEVCGIDSTPEKPELGCLSSSCP